MRKYTNRNSGLLTHGVSSNRALNNRSPRAVARALIGGGGGGVYSYIRVMPDEFRLKLTFTSSGITRIYEYTPPN